MASANYALGWGTNRDSLSTGIGVREDEAIQHARGLVDQMRRDGAGSAIRHVRVRHWPYGGSLSDAPVVYQASYYDREQELTAAEVYAARVHDWHALVDRLNAHYVARNTQSRAGYRAWSDSWGAQPASCPGCGATFEGRV